MLVRMASYVSITMIANIASITSMNSTVSISGAKITGKLFPHIVFHSLLYLYYTYRKVFSPVGDG